MANKDICGMQCAAWFESDSVMAANQLTIAEIQKAQIEHPRIASEAAHEARMEVLRCQTERDRQIIKALRNRAFKPGWSNQSMVAEIFGLGWSSAFRACKEMGIDPDSRTVD